MGVPTVGICGVQCRLELYLVGYTHRTQTKCSIARDVRALRDEACLDYDLPLWPYFVRYFEVSLAASLAGPPGRPHVATVSYFLRLFGKGFPLRHSSCPWRDVPQIFQADSLQPPFWVGNVERSLQHVPGSTLRPGLPFLSGLKMTPPPFLSHNLDE